MRRVLTSLIVLIVIMSGTLAPTIVAQEATPDSGDLRLKDEMDTGAFTYTMADGTELATMTVQEVLDPFEDTADGFVPAEGTHPVMVQVQVENSGEMPFELRPDQMIVQDNDGYLWRPSTVPRVVEEIIIPDLQRVVLAPGDRVTGMVGFQIPDQASVATVLLSPESSRLLVVSSHCGRRRWTGRPR